MPDDTLALKSLGCSEGRQAFLVVFQGVEMKKAIICTKLLR